MQGPPGACKSTGRRQTGVMVNRLFQSFLVVLVLLFPPALVAQNLLTGNRSAQEPVKLELVAGDADNIGLQVSLAPGWKFYWRTPGEGGVPPHFDWSGSDNLAAAHIVWPAPHRITIGDTDLYGYTGQVILPIAVTRKNKDAVVSLSLRIEYGVCKDICILREDHLRHRTDAAEAPDARNLARLALWQARVPLPAGQAGIRLLSRSAAGGRLTLVLSSDRPLEKPDLLVEGPPEAWYGRPAVSLSADRREGHFVLPVKPDVAAMAPLILTLVDDGLAAELKVAKP